jgi:hypothetical protein
VIAVNVRERARIGVVAAPAAGVGTEGGELERGSDKCPASGGQRLEDAGLAEADDVGHAAAVNVRNRARVGVIAAPAAGVGTKGRELECRQCKRSGKFRGGDGGKVRAELRPNHNAIARADDGAATQIRQRERDGPIAAVGRTQQREQGLILIDRQQLAIGERPAGRREVARKGHDFAEKRRVGVNHVRINFAWKDSVDRDQVVQCQRRFAVLEWLHDVAKAIRRLTIGQTDGWRSNQGAKGIRHRCADDGAAAQIGQRERGHPVAAVNRAD